MTGEERSAQDGRDEDAEIRTRIRSFTNVGHGMEKAYARTYQAAIDAVVAWHAPKMLLLEDETEWDSGGCRCGYARPCPTSRHGSDRAAAVQPPQEALVTDPLPPAERHDDPRQVLIDAYPFSWVDDAEIEADAVLIALTEAGYTVVKAAEPIDVAVHSLQPEARWQQHAIRHPDDGAVYDSFDGTLAAAQRLAARVEGSTILVRDHVVGPWRPVGEETTDAD